MHRAANAFSRVVTLDSDDGEAWSNLAASYIEMNRPREAYQALIEAAKALPKNWKIIQNMVCLFMEYFIFF
jgi:Flp pilus assembly protein TadD